MKELAFVADSGYADIGVPEGSRAMARQSFEQTREHWSLVSEKPERRATLAEACVQQQEASQAAMSRYDCAW